MKNPPVTKEALVEAVAKGVEKRLIRHLPFALRKSLEELGPTHLKAAWKDIYDDPKVDVSVSAREVVVTFGGFRGTRVHIYLDVTVFHGLGRASV